MNKILFLGAGACKDAGLPLASELIKEIEGFSPIDIIAKECLGDLKNLLQNKNKNFEELFQLRYKDPELFFSLIDLLCHSKDPVSQRLYEKIIKNDPSSAYNGEEINMLIHHPAYEELHIAEKIKEKIGYLINEYFMRTMHDILFSVKNSSNCDYLRQCFSYLSKGDVVITTNWDLFAEKILYDLNKWNPKDGYGFNIPFVKDKEMRQNGARTDISRSYCFPELSYVKVFKLHGSIGWYLNSKNQIYFSRYRYHPFFNYHYERIHDTNMNKYGPDEINPIMIYPSYLKQLGNNELQIIWDKARCALIRAKEVTFVGYSLPDADMAVRVLLNPLKKRLRQNKVQVNIVLGPPPDKDFYFDWEDLKNRWSSFLSDKIKFHECSASNYFLNQ